jgi:hypothetical protein
VLHSAHTIEAIQNPETRAAIDEAERMLKDPGHVYFTDVRDMLDALDQECVDA